jgi:hypothetical protein
VFLVDNRGSTQIRLKVYLAFAHPGLLITYRFLQGPAGMFCMGPEPAA